MRLPDGVCECGRTQGNNTQYSGAVWEDKGFGTCRRRSISLWSDAARSRLLGLRKQDGGEPPPLTLVADRSFGFLLLFGGLGGGGFWTATYTTPLISNPNAGPLPVPSPPDPNPNPNTKPNPNPNPKPNPKSN